VSKSEQVSSSARVASTAFSARSLPMSYTSDHPVWTRTCAGCDSPVDLESCKADEHRRPAHKECYIHKIRPTQAAPKPRHRVVQLPSFLGDSSARDLHASPKRRSAASLETTSAWRNITISTRISYSNWRRASRDVRQVNPWKMRWTVSGEGLWLTTSGNRGPA
jgi:hypothetical protein